MQFRWLLTSLACFILSSGCHGVDPPRAKEIQKALRSHEHTEVRVTGQMDGPTMAALKMIAKEHHWQSKSVPDARVLEFIGLGPSQDKLLNPDTAVLPRFKDIK